MPLGHHENELHIYSRDEDQIRVQLPGRLPLARYLDKLPLEINNEKRTSKPVLGTDHSTSRLDTSGGDVPSSERSITNQPAVTGAPPSSTVLALGKPRETLAPYSLPQSPMLRNTDDASKRFAETERLGLRATQEQSQKLRHEKNAKLADLMEFADRFRLKRQVPDDLVPVRAEDQQEQLQTDVKTKALPALMSRSSVTRSKAKCRLHSTCPRSVTCLACLITYINSTNICKLDKTFLGLS